MGTSGSIDRQASTYGGCGSSPYIFGVGFGRTGSTSLSKALGLLHIPCLHYPRDRANLEALLNDQHPLPALARYRAIVDGIAAFFRSLDHAYPNSKFILTVRDPAELVCSHAILLETKQKINETQPDYVRRFDAESRRRIFGLTDISEEVLLKGYHQHNEAVEKHFAGRPDALLVLDIPAGDQWEPLCRFLDVPQPQISFPHLHKTAAAVTWSRKLLLAWETINSIVAPKERFILLDDCQLNFAFDNAQPFIEKDGLYYGIPPSDQVAIAELERMRRNGACYLIIAWCSSWWLDYFPMFRRHMEGNYGLVCQNEAIMCFKLN